ncbi:MAG TPA: hypothetical protein VMP01_04890 [Pirellulaceae bacterium]|nr:hypothetical protein [Pirellulaceae bacterium]
MTKGAKRRKPEPEPESEEDEVPFGYLPTADPPRKNVGLLAMAAVALVVWMLALIYLALWNR